MMTGEGIEATLQEIVRGGVPPSTNGLIGNAMDSPEFVTLLRDNIETFKRTHTTKMFTDTMLMMFVIGYRVGRADAETEALERLAL